MIIYIPKDTMYTNKSNLIIGAYRWYENGADGNVCIVDCYSSYSSDNYIQSMAVYAFINNSWVSINADVKVFYI